MGEDGRAGNAEAQPDTEGRAHMLPVGLAHGFWMFSEKSGNHEAGPKFEQRGTAYADRSRVISLNYSQESLTVFHQLGLADAVHLGEGVEA